MYSTTASCLREGGLTLMHPHPSPETNSSRIKGCMHPVPTSTTYAQSRYQSVRYYDIEPATAPSRSAADVIWKLEAMACRQSPQATCSIMCADI